VAEQAKNLKKTFKLLKENGEIRFQLSSMRKPMTIGEASLDDLLQVLDYLDQLNNEKTL
jgi:hypothetical protein